MGNPVFGITYLPDFDPLRELSATMSFWDDTSHSGLLPKTSYSFQVTQSQRPLVQLPDWIKAKTSSVQGTLQYILIHVLDC